MNSRSIKNLLPNNNSKYHQSYFEPKNRNKFSGSYPIICRSLLERKFCEYLDTNDEILFWNSEGLTIQYISIVDNKQHKYYPDFIFKTKTERVIVEVKPSGHLIKPKEPKKQTVRSLKNYRISMKIYLTNYSKFEAAKKFAAENGFKFVWITEQEINKLIK